MCGTRPVFFKFTLIFFLTISIGAGFAVSEAQSKSRHSADSAVVADASADPALAYSAYGAYGAYGAYATTPTRTDLQPVTEPVVEPSVYRVGSASTATNDIAAESKSAKKTTQASPLIERNRSAEQRERHERSRPPVGNQGL